MSVRFKYKTQKYQTDAVDSIIAVFNGQNPSDLIEHGHDFGTKEIDKQTHFHEDGHSSDAPIYKKESMFAYSNNRIVLTDSELLDNVHRIQDKNNIPLSKDLDKSLGQISLDIEMETGTGKTYVYTKAMYELKKHYGWSKFIIVVPTVAIREGVKNSLEQTREHFRELYGEPINFFTYDSSNLKEIDIFDQSKELYVMIINYQAFALDFDEEKTKNREKNRRNGKRIPRKVIFEKRDEFYSRAPIDIIKENNPIVILDEPQKLSGATTQKVLRDHFNVLFSMNFSATHKNEHNTVYVLDALDAYNQKLVKRIEVKGFDIDSIGGTSSYIYFDSIKLDEKRPPQAKIEIEVKTQTGTPKKYQYLEEGNSLYSASGELPQYKGMIVERINTFDKTIIISGGIVLRMGDSYGDNEEDELRKLQIHETIVTHLAREQYLYHKGIKCLSLFFIDHVDNYRIYDGDTPILGKYGVMFEKEYKRILSEQQSMFDPDYIAFLKKFDVSELHEGYFSIDRKTKHDIDSSFKKEGEAELAAYQKILNAKEELLKVDEPLRFIFSHSALSEGWDNPNIFQICALKHTVSGPDANRRRRQEVGRGLRLCLDENGNRMDYETVGDSVHEINLLTVIANESYGTYVAGLQDATKDLIRKRPVILDKAFFLEYQYVDPEGNKKSLSEQQATKMYRYLISNNLIDDYDKINNAVSKEILSGNIPELPEELKPIENEIKKLLTDAALGTLEKKLYGDGRKNKQIFNKVNKNFDKEVFQKLWDEISRRYVYFADFDSNTLVEDACKRIESELSVTKLRYTKTTGRQDVVLTREKIEAGKEFVSQKRSETREIKNVVFDDVEYDLIGEIAKRCTLTRRTVANILKNLTSRTFGMFKDNPEEFIRKVSEKINDSKVKMVVEHIEYHKSAEAPYDSTIFTESRYSEDSNTILKDYSKHVADYIFTDGIAADSVEKRFADQLEEQTAVSYYAKLPRGFHIPTPVGNYSPDWAIAFDESADVRHIFFVAETKGNSGAAQLREVEHAKTQCARKLFNKQKLNKARYEVVKDYKELLNKINGIE